MTSISVSRPAVVALSPCTKHLIASVWDWLRCPTLDSLMILKSSWFLKNTVVGIFLSDIGMFCGCCDWSPWNLSSKIAFVLTSSTPVLHWARASICDIDCSHRLNWSWKSYFLRLICSWASILWFSTSAIDSCPLRLRVSISELTICCILSLLIWERCSSKSDFSSSSLIKLPIVSIDFLAISSLEARLLFTSLAATSKCSTSCLLCSTITQVWHTGISHSLQ